MGIQMKLRDMTNPMVLGYALDRQTLTPIRRQIDVAKTGDYGADPLGDGTFRMVPSGDIVDLTERNKRLVNYCPYGYGECQEGCAYPGRCRSWGQSWQSE